MLEFKNYLKDVKNEYTQFEIDQVKDDFNKDKNEYLIAEESFYNEKRRFEEIREKYLKQKNKFEDFIQNVKIIK